VDDPEPECDPEIYEKKYNPNQQWKPIHRFRIPVESEVNRLQEKVRKLEKELAELRNKP